MAEIYSKNTIQIHFQIFCILSFTEYQRFVCSFNDEQNTVTTGSFMNFKLILSDHGNDNGIENRL